MYRKLEIDGFGEVEFYGNAGVMAQLEDELNISLAELGGSGKLGMHTMFILLYWAHYVACKRLKKAIVMDREDIKFNVSGAKLMEITPLLVEDILTDLGISKDNAGTKKKRN